jgi:hypothetical protein
LLIAQLRLEHLHLLLISHLDLISSNFSCKDAGSVRASTSSCDQAIVMASSEGVLSLSEKVNVSP